ncbi:EF-hand domain-containing protein [Ramlibacter sp. H39-3-26]|uniref:EF-hand domain-containing protein n=1 Tax=Curvibacter soli TaxID=3031331 RepID=UPI0023D9BA2A|nr:EF-hand domain-containing protein [Ramlibacter sp. H39-3-26]MDF1485622.1 EF-hand domain-containing protein [Ramlibacter sp. H39-3-26]
MTSRRRLHDFDARSVILFASLTLGAVAQAQTFGPGPAPRQGTAATATATTVAFDRADTDKDGKLSHREAGALPAVAQMFDRIDTDHDGAISRAEFERGVKTSSPSP